MRTNDKEGVRVASSKTSTYVIVVIVVDIGSGSTGISQVSFAVDGHGMGTLLSETE